MSYSEDKYIIRRHVTPTVGDLNALNGSVCKNALGISHCAEMKFWFEPQFDFDLSVLQLPADYETMGSTVTYRWKGNRWSWQQTDVAAVCRAAAARGTYGDGPRVAGDYTFDDDWAYALLTTRYGQYHGLHLVSDRNLSYWLWRMSLRLVIARIYVEKITWKDTGEVEEIEGEVSASGDADFETSQLTTGVRLGGGRLLYGSHVSGTLLNSGVSVKAYASYV